MSTGFGRDVWAFGGVRNGRYATGIHAGAQAAYNRLRTPRGTNPGGPEESIYGIDLTELIGSMGDDLAVVALPAMIKGELAKDDRFRSVDVAIDRRVQDDGTLLLGIAIDIRTFEEGGDFRLTFTASAARLSLPSVVAL